MRPSDRNHPLGAEVRAGGVHCRIWAPRSGNVGGAFEQGASLVLAPEGAGYFSGLGRAHADRCFTGCLFDVVDGSDGDDPYPVLAETRRRGGK